MLFSGTALCHKKMGVADFRFLGVGRGQKHESRVSYPADYFIMKSTEYRYLPAEFRKRCCKESFLRAEWLSPQQHTPQRLVINTKPTV